MAGAIRSGTLENGHTRSGWRDSAGPALCYLVSSWWKFNFKEDATQLGVKNN